MEQVREIIVGIGLPSEQYAGDSSKIGAAPRVAMARVEDSTIQILGRWHSTSYLQYIRMPSERLAGLSMVLAGRTGTTTV